MGSIRMDSPMSDEELLIPKVVYATPDNSTCGDSSFTSNNSKDHHCHDAQLDTVFDRRARRKLIIASILCLSFLIAEAIGGLIAGSIAILTDAAHLLTDFASFMISLLALYLGTRPATKRFSFGWHRAEVVGALLSVLMIWVITGILFYMAVERALNPDYTIDANVMLITAGCGVAFNIFMGLTLHSPSHGHNHGGLTHSGHHHSNHDDSSLGAYQSLNHSDVSVDDGGGRQLETENLNVRAAFIHVLGDFVQSIGVLVAAYIIWFKPEWKIVDPICTFLFSILVLISTINILRDILRVLMEGTPRGVKFMDVKRSLLELEGITQVHNLRIWCITTGRTALSAHLTASCFSEPTACYMLLRRAEALLRTRFDINESTLQIEPYSSGMDNCRHCQDPRD